MTPDTRIWLEHGERTMTCLRLVGCALVFVCATAAEPVNTKTGDATSAAGWPQWRGPTRDGIAPAGAKLLDSWPAGGPKLLWKSAPIKGRPLDGGVGSVAVAEGKVIVYVNNRGTGKPTKVITAAQFKRWAWTEGMPDDVSVKMEKVRQGLDLRIKPGILVDGKLSMLLASLTPEQAAKYEENIRTRLTNTVRLDDGGEVREGLPDWRATGHTAKLVDKEYASVAEYWQDITTNVNAGNDTWIYAKLGAEAFPSFDTIICLDAATGKHLWEKTFPGRCRVGQHQACWAASGTPAIAEGRCYAQGSAGIYCLSMKDGSLVWQQESNYSSSAPLVANGVVYAMTPWLTAIKADTGKILWLQDKGPSYHEILSTSPMPWMCGNRLTLLTLGSGKAPYCVDAAGGSVIWESTKDQCQANVTPVIVGDVLVGSGVAMKLTEQGPEKLWNLKDYRDRASSLTVHRDHVYAHMGGGPFCFDFKTGEMKWKGPGNYGGEGYSAVLADGKFIGCWGADAAREVVMYKAIPEKYEELGRFKANAAYGSSPAVADGKLFLRLEDGIACYDLAK